MFIISQNPGEKTPETINNSKISITTAGKLVNFCFFLFMDSAFVKFWEMAHLFSLSVYKTPSKYISLNNFRYKFKKKKEIQEVMS